jgi:hypothetical protein
MISNEEFVPSAPRLSFLDPGRCVAFQIRYAAAVAFRPGGLPAATENAMAVLDKRILVPLFAMADDVRATGNPMAAKALNAACEHVRSADLSSAGTSAVVIQSRIASFIDRIKSVIENEIEAPMPAEIDRLFYSLDAFVAGLYQQFSSVEIVWPKVFIDLGYLDSDQTTDALDASAITASCRLRDDGTPISIVKLSIRDDSFDWTSACQLPYVLLHELLCHAYQGIAAPAERGQQRIVVDGSCAWTEGWMDVLALWTAMTWLKNHPSEPEWVARESGSLQVAFAKLHARRAEAQSTLPRLQRERRTAAREAVGHLLAEMSRFYTGPDREDLSRERVYAFSLSLNTLRIQQTDRDQQLDNLAVALELTVDLDQDELISALLEFTRHPNWETLNLELTRLLS